jgi:Na+-driven multidrug efflux pump
MWAGLWTNWINVALNTLFLFVFHWGIFGIALSTVLGRIGGLVYALLRARRHERRRIEQGETPGTKLDPRPYHAVLRLAVPSSITFALISLETGMVNFLLSRQQHATEAIAAYSIYYRVVLFGLQPVIATAVAMLPFAARRVGARDFDGVRRGLRQAAGATAAYAVLVVGPLTALLAPWLAARLAESPLTREYTTFAMYTVPLACLLGAMFLLCRPVFEALNRGRPGLLMAALRYLVLTAPFALGGMQVARSLDRPPLYGMIVGLLAVAAISSSIFYAWTRGALARAAAGAEPD